MLLKMLKKLKGLKHKHIYIFLHFYSMNLDLRMAPILGYIVLNVVFGSTYSTL